MSLPQLQVFSTASCSSDEKVTGGGYTLTNNLGPGANVVSSKAVGNSWEVKGYVGWWFYWSYTHADLLLNVLN